MRDRSPHLCRNHLGTAICASNGIGPGRSDWPRQRLERCAVCGRWWRLSAATTRLTIWTETPEWTVRLLYRRTWNGAREHKKEKES